MPLGADGFVPHVAGSSRPHAIEGAGSRATARSSPRVTAASSTGDAATPSRPTRGASTVKLAEVRRHALSLPAVTEEPHFHYASFRVRGRIFVTVPPEETHLHVFVGEDERERAMALYPAFVERLTWGAKVVGLRVALATAPPAVVRDLVESAWRTKAPTSLARAHDGSDVSSKPAPRRRATARPSDDGGKR